MKRTKLRSVPDSAIPPEPPPPPPSPERVRYISQCSESLFNNRWGDQRQWLTIGQLSKAYVSHKRVNVFGLDVTKTDLDLLRFVFTFGAIQGGRHRWQVYGGSMTLARSLSRRTQIDKTHVYRSLVRLRKLELLHVEGQEVWTTRQTHRIGGELLWCDLLSSACPDSFDQQKLDWYTVTKDVDRIFAKRKLDPTRSVDRREVMMDVIEEVQRRCT